MKFKNKRTGEIGEPRIAYQEIYIDTENRMTYCYKTLDGVFKEWEDYEEPKFFWYIDDFMIMCGTEGEFTTPDLASFTKKDIEKLKAIGNFFSSKEEAEKAVERLRAWQRLKDKGFRFGGWKRDKRFYGDYTIEAQDYTTCSDKDLDICFGGEE